MHGDAADVSTSIGQERDEWHPAATRGGRSVHLAGRQEAARHGLALLPR